MQHSSEKNNHAIVVYGQPGVGKTTLALQSPVPYVIDAEGSIAGGHNAYYDRAESFERLMSLLEDFIAGKQNKELAEKVSGTGQFKTLVIDSWDWVEKMAIDFICKRSGESYKILQDVGEWGRGYALLRKLEEDLLGKVSSVINMGYNVVITAHADDKEVKTSDQISFSRTSLKLEKKTAALLKEWSEAILYLGFADPRMTITVDKKGNRKGTIKAVEMAERFIATTSTSSWEAKNRCNMPPEIPFDKRFSMPYIFAHMNGLFHGIKKDCKTRSEYIEKLAGLLIAKGTGTKHPIDKLNALVDKFRAIATENEPTWPFFLAMQKLKENE